MPTFKEAKYRFLSSVVVNSVIYNAAADADFEFVADFMLFYNETDSADVFISFDGIDDHVLVNGTKQSMNPRKFEGRAESKVWIRKAGGADQTVNIEAYRNL